jgi:hypothetical protein
MPNHAKRRTKFVQLDLDEREKLAFQMASVLAGVALGSWARERLRSAARRELTDFGHKVPFLPDSDLADWELERLRSGTRGPA